MSYQELWETTMDPEHRILKQVHIEDAAAADETFSMLMGDEVEPRASSSSATPRTCVGSMRNGILQPPSSEGGTQRT